MKCKECGSKINITVDNLMIFSYQAFFKCEKCQTCYSEEEINKELEKIYWKECGKK